MRIHERREARDDLRAPHYGSRDLYEFLMGGVETRRLGIEDHDLFLFKTEDGILRTRGEGKIALRHIGRRPRYKQLPEKVSRHQLVQSTSQKAGYLVVELLAVDDDFARYESHRPLESAYLGSITCATP